MWDICLKENNRNFQKCGEELRGRSQVDQAWFLAVSFEIAASILFAWFAAYLFVFLARWVMKGFRSA
jgi:hypothetical protein